MAEAGFDAARIADAVAAVTPLATQMGTTCGGCMGRGVMTMHSPAGDEHAAWEAKWVADPSWMPEGVTPWRPLAGLLNHASLPVGAIFKYDGNANALYYRLTSEPVVRTVSIGDRVMVDVDAAGEAVGIEVLDPPGFSISVEPVSPLPYFGPFGAFSPILPVPVDEPGRDPASAAQVDAAGVLKGNAR